MWEECYSHDYSEDIFIKELKSEVKELSEEKKFEKFVRYIAGIAKENFSKLDLEQNVLNDKIGIEFVYWICLKRICDKYIGMHISKTRLLLGAKKADFISKRITSINRIKDIDDKIDNLYKPSIKEEINETPKKERNVLKWITLKLNKELNNL